MLKGSDAPFAIYLAVYNCLIPFMVVWYLPFSDIALIKLQKHP